MRRTATGSLGAFALATLMAGTIASPAAAATAELPKLVVDDPSISTEVSPTKVDVMGLWAHPDDDAGFTTPCGVWNDLYGITCGIIMETRGEGGSNSVGPEAGPDLGLRRENEDRTSHVRSGTIDIYNVDRVDFWYNTSAPLTAEVWDKEEGLRQTVRILRETQPDILMASSPRASGHGNHQYAQGRMVWEAARAAADPNMYPEQLTGPDAVEPWQVKKIVGIGGTTGTGGISAENCNTDFVPNVPYTVVGTWTGYDSPYVWAEGNTAGQPAGSPKTWAQVGREGGRAHPTQARVMQKDVWAVNCQRYAIAESIVPFQPNGTEDSGRDDAILFGAVIADPGGMPLGSTMTIAPEEHFAAPGTPFQVTVAMQSGGADVASGSLSLSVPSGWTVSAAQNTGAISSAAAVERTFTVTPAADAAVGLAKIGAHFDNGTVSAYNDVRVEVVQPVEGRVLRWGNQAEYEEWAADYTWLGGRGTAIIAIGAGESVTVPVIVSNRSTVSQSGTVTLTAPTGFTLDSVTKNYSLTDPGAETRVDFVLTSTNMDALASTATMKVTTTFGEGQTSSEDATISLVPTTVIPKADTAPMVDGAVDDSYGDPISLANKWEGSDCTSATDCGGASEARLAWHGDDLYVHVKVIDDVVSSAATPDRCFGHWLVDSVEILLDPLGGSVDPSTTFKSGIFPFTDDAENFNGNGVNGPCWSRDADNHQGFSTGPLAEDVLGAPNSPGQQVAVDVEFNNDGTYADGYWVIETKIPLANLPAAVATSEAPTGVRATNTIDPSYLGLNVTPYDSDRTDFIGETRTAWSAHGGQQSEPYRWGHAYLDEYTAPEGRSFEPKAAIIPNTALKSVESPQSIAQSADRGVTLSGLQPSRALEIGDVAIAEDAITIDVDAAEAGTVRAFLWNGNQQYIPVWTTSCVGDEYGFDACSAEDGKAPYWGDDMSGRLLGSVVAPVNAGASQVEVPVTGDFKKLAEQGAILVSWEAASGGVNAWNFPVKEQKTFTDVPADHQFAEAISWLADKGITEGYEDGTFGTTRPVTRQAMAAFVYRYVGEDFVPAAGTQTFTDVSSGHPFYKEIEWMAAEGLSTGYADGTFGGDRAVSRQAMAAFLYRLAGEPTVTGAPSFSDVAPGSQFASAIRWMETTELSTGYADGTYRGADAVSRQAMAAFLYRYDQLDS